MGRSGGQRSPPAYRVHRRPYKLSLINWLAVPPSPPATACLCALDGRAAAQPPAPAARDRGLPIGGSSLRWGLCVGACLHIACPALQPFHNVSPPPLRPPPPAAAPRFEVHRLLLADSGTLLLCSVDTTGHLAALRKRLRQAYPGAPPRQSTIVHASIARLLDDGRQLAPAEIAAVQVRV